jgi:hypothetical protein
MEPDLGLTAAKAKNFNSKNQANNHDTPSAAGRRKMLTGTKIIMRTPRV